MHPDYLTDSADNIVLHGAMHPRHYVRLEPLTEAEIDAQIAANRERYDDAFDREEWRRHMRPRAVAPSVIALDNSMLARVIRWAQWALRMRGPL